jgi:menaquinone-dependent protoporphyrinogen oxidase
MVSTARFSRRRLLFATGGAVAAGMLMGGCGPAPAGATAPAGDFGQTSCREESEVKKILVVYASHYGSTADVAKAIGEQLCQRGEAVDVRPADDVTDLSPYRAVAIGSAVNGGRWLPAASSFVTRNADALSQMPAAIFSCHLMNLGDSAASQKKRQAYTAPVRAMLSLQSEAFFAGKSSDGQSGPVMSFVAKLFGIKSGDQRDWPAIRAWADQLFPA